MWEKLFAWLSVIGAILTIWTFWDDISPKVLEFHPISSSYQLAPGTNDTYVCTAACGPVVLQWRIQGRQSSAFLDSQPVELSSERSFDPAVNRKFVLVAKGLVQDDFKTVTILDKTSSSTPTPTATPAPTSNTNTETQTPRLPPTLTILYPKVGPIYTKNQVAAQVTSQIAAYFKARDYELAPTPSGVHSLDQYVSMSRNNAVAGAGWAVQADVEMRPTYQPRNPRGIMPNQVLPGDSHAVVDMIMNCSITINMVRLPLGDHPATAVGLGKTMRTIYMTAMTGTVRDYEFSREAAEKATANALGNLQVEVWK